MREPKSSLIVAVGQFGINWEPNKKKRLLPKKKQPTDMISQTSRNQKKALYILYPHSRRYLAVSQVLKNPARTTSSKFSTDLSQVHFRVDSDLYVNLHDRPFIARGADYDSSSTIQGAKPWQMIPSFKSWKPNMYPFVKKGSLCSAISPTSKQI